MGGIYSYLDLSVVISNMNPNQVEVEEWDNIVA